MDNSFSKEPMLELYIAETSQMIEQLEQLVLDSENNGFGASIDEIFRIMHSIKGSSAMMLFNNIAHLAHSLEDLFDYFRTAKKQNINQSKVADIVLEGIDFFKSELSKMEGNTKADGNAEELTATIKKYLDELKGTGDQSDEAAQVDEVSSQDQKYYISALKNIPEASSNARYKAVIFFIEDCEAENLRAFTIVHGLKELVEDIQTFPENLIGNAEAVDEIKKDGLKIIFSTGRDIEEVRTFFTTDPFVDKLELGEIEDQELPKKKKIEIILDESEVVVPQKEQAVEQSIDKGSVSGKQSAISVSISKLDTLMDLVGELVIAEAMVTQNPELQGLNLDGFHKAARQLKKISNELQDSVMAIRMVPLAMTFQKMNRVVRDMSHKLNKEVQLEIIGEETEVDKSIIENISDPLMHLIRNSMDHGIEAPEERVSKGKPAKGKLTLEAKNSGSDVWVIITDDGKGLDKEQILKKAKEKGILPKPEDELTDKEIYSLIFLPGFSTKEAVTEFSGRGVGMDVVMKNIEKIRGSINVDSKVGQGTTISIKIPLTLAIIDGMGIKVGNSRYTMPITSVVESFKVTEDDVIRDPQQNEMIMVRGECYPILRLHELYNVKTDITKISDGIITMVEEDGKLICIFSDALIGEHQVVVKALPKYIKKVRGVAGCTLLGDGSISLILDIASLIKTVLG